MRFPVEFSVVITLVLHDLLLELSLRISKWQIFRDKILSEFLNNEGVIQNISETSAELVRSK
jgi:hypothetical protein